MGPTHSIVGLLMIGTALSCGAAQIGIGDFSGGETVITFEAPIIATANPVFYQGVLFTPLGSFISPTPSALATTPGTEMIASYPDGNVLRDYTGYTHLQMDFGPGAHRIGLTLANGITDADYGWDLTAYDSSLAPLGTIQVRPPGPDYRGPIFTAFEFTEGISRVEVREWGICFLGASFLDNVRFEAVPEASVAFLLSSGVVAYIGVHRLTRRITGK